MLLLPKHFSSKSVLLVSTALLSTLSANSAYATYYYTKQSYSHCGSSSQTSEQSKVCNSPLGEYNYDLVDNKVTQNSPTDNAIVQIDGLNIDMSAFSDTQGITGETVVGAKLEKISDKCEGGGGGSGIVGGNGGNGGGGGVGSLTDVIAYAPGHMDAGNPQSGGNIGCYSGGSDRAAGSDGGSEDGSGVGGGGGGGRSSSIPARHKRVIGSFDSTALPLYNGTIGTFYF